METTVKERAKAYATKYVADEFDDYGNGRMDGKELGYIQGATDQKKIDIDKAWHFIWNILISKGTMGVEIYQTKEGFNNFFYENEIESDMEEINKTIEILQAIKENKPIEYRTNCSPWLDWTGVPTHIFEKGYEYRVKPQPSLRPFNSAEEFIKASKEHGQRLKWKTTNGVFYSPIRMDDKSLTFLSNDCHIYEYSYTTIMNDCLFEDDSPCGIIE